MICFLFNNKQSEILIMKKTLLTLLLSFFILPNIANADNFVDFNGTECINQDIRVERVSEHQYHFSGHVDLPGHCYEMSIHVPYVPKIKSKQRVWGTLFLEKIYPGKSCATPVLEQEIHIKTPAYEVLSTNVKSRIEVESDFAWSPIAYIGEPPKNVGEVTCLEPVTIHDESRGLDRLN